MSEVQLGVEFCRASKEDFEAIMAISIDIYAGIDYLPSRFFHWIEDPNREVIIAKKEKKVVAMQVIFIVDNGQTAVFQALRVASQERGRGIAKLINMYCASLLNTEYPHIKVFRQTITDMSPFINKGHRFLSDQAVISCLFKASHIRTRLDQILKEGDWSRREDSHPATLTAEDVKRIYMDQRVISTLLPGKTIIQERLPYMPIESNLNLLLQKGLSWMADTVKDPKTLSICNTPYRIPKGEDFYCIDIDLYGTDLSGVKSSIIAQLMKVQESIKGTVICNLFMEPVLKQELYHFCVDIMESQIFEAYSQLILMEGDLCYYT